MASGTVTWAVFLLRVSSCLFLSPNPVIMFLQLCDMSDAVLDTCEGDFQGKLAPAHLALRLLASPASQPPGCHPSHRPSSHCMWLRPTNSMPTSLPGFPQPRGGPFGLGACGFLSTLACFSSLLIRSWERHPAEGPSPFCPPKSPS